jgi:transposase
MIAIPHQAKIFVCLSEVDFRCGINTLGGICRDTLKQDPMSGAIFVFRNRRRNTLKILVYDGEAFWLLIRRLSSGTIKWWPKATTSSNASTIQAKELQTLILGGNPAAAEFSNDWKKIIK